MAKPFIKKITFDSGATRSEISPARFDLITPIGLRRLAETYAEGAAIHGERNWENGLPMDDCINRAVRHIYLYLSGDTSEDHLAHAAWNLFATMHFQEKNRSSHNNPYDSLAKVFEDVKYSSARSALNTGFVIGKKAE